MICPRCGADSRTPDLPILMSTHAVVTVVGRVDYLRLTCRCGWSENVTTDTVRTEADADALAADLAARWSS